LIDGTVEITPKSDGLVDPLQLLRATYDSGVSVAEMSMIARGRIVRNSSGRFDFLIGSSRSFPIVNNEVSAQLEPMAGSEDFVTIKGLLFQKQKGEKARAPSVLQITVLEIEQKE